MSDESFFREVSEELRQDRIKAIWTRFGAIIVGTVVVIILAVAGYVGWDRYSRTQADASGDRYLAALDLGQEGRSEEAISALQGIVADGWGAYRELARMSIANEQSKAGSIEEAVAAYEEVADDSGVPQALRDMARLRAAYLLVDSGSLADVRAHADDLIADDNALRYAAREAIGLAAWRAEDQAAALENFQVIADAGDAPNGISQRAQLMLDLIASGEAAPDAPTMETPSSETAAPVPSENAVPAAWESDPSADEQPEPTTEAPASGPTESGEADAAASEAPASERQPAATQTAPDAADDSSPAAPPTE